MSLGIIVMLLFPAVIAVNVVMLSYESLFDKMFSISKGKYVPRSIAGYIFNAIRKHKFTFIKVSMIYAIIFTLTMSLMTFAGQCITKLFVADYKLTMLACNDRARSTSVEDKKIASIMARSMEQKLSIYKNKDKRAYGLFDTFITDEIYELPNRIIYEGVQ